MSAEPIKSWTRLLGSSDYDVAHSVTTGSDGSIYIAGYTHGNLDGNSNAGTSDAFLSKYNSDGTKSWTRLLGTSKRDHAYSVTTGSDGSIYIAGETSGNLDGNSNAGNPDAFLSKYNSDGTKSWTRLIGSSGYDYASSVTTGSDGSIYIAGGTEGNLDGNDNAGYQDAFLSKYNSDGTKSWTRLLGTSKNDHASSVTTGSDGSIYIAGYTTGNLDDNDNAGYEDAFLSKYNSDGTKSWTRLLGTSKNDHASSVTTGSDGSIYIAGSTEGNLDGNSNNGVVDAFLSKYTSDGTKSWTRLLGSSAMDSASSVTTGSDGSIYIAGWTQGNLHGNSNTDGDDVFLSKYNSDGTKSWTRLLGSSEYDFARSVTTGSDGSIYIAGYTFGNRDGNSNTAGGSDAFLSKFSFTPTYTLTPSATTINEGAVLTSTVATTNVASGTTLYYTLSGTGITTADFSAGALTGEGITDATEKFSFSHTLANDLLTEGAETLNIKLFTDSARTVQVGSTASVSIADTSITLIRDNMLLADFSTPTHWLSIPDIYTVENGKLISGDNYDWGNIKITFKPTFVAGTGSVVRLQFEFEYDSSLLSTYETHQDTRPFGIWVAPSTSSNNYAIGAIESQKLNIPGSKNQYDFNVWTYGSVLSNFNNAPLKSEREVFSLESKDAGIYSYEMGLIENDLAYVKQSISSTITGETAISYFEFYDAPYYRDDKHFTVSLQLFRQSGLTSIDNLAISGEILNRTPTGTPTVTGTFKVGSTLTIDATAIKDSDNFTGYTPTFKYNWETSTDGTTWSKLTTIDGADNNNTYILTATEANKKIRGVVSYLDGYGTNEVVNSAASESITPAVLPTQSLTLAIPSKPAIRSGVNTTSSITYDVSTGDTALAGIGASLYFDSTQLSVSIAGDPFKTGLLGNAITADTSNADGDLKTDKVLSLSYADFGGNFPGSGTTLPLLLANLNLVPTNTFSGSTLHLKGDPAVGFTATGADLLIAHNAAPVVNGLIPALSTNRYTPFSYTLRSDLFSDSDSTLSFSATTNTGDTLPSWLSFNPTTRTLSGTPTTGGSINLNLSAADELGSVSTPLSLKIKEVQSLSSSTTPIRYQRNKELTVPINYSTSDGSSTTGLSFKVHYNSSLLSFDSTTGITNKAQADLFQIGATQQDTANTDNDATTDSFIPINIASFTGKFPTTEVPIKLADLIFKAVDKPIDSITGFKESFVNFTEIETASGYGFTATSASLKPISFSLDVDGDGKITALGDGLMIIRKLFGAAFAGDALTNKAMSPTSTRTTAEIHEFIQQGITTGLLDVDKDGKTTALGDGLMVIRHLFGAAFANEALTNKAISPSSPYLGPPINHAAVAANIDAMRPA